MISVLLAVPLLSSSSCPPLTVMVAEPNGLGVAPAAPPAIRMPPSSTTLLVLSNVLLLIRLNVPMPVLVSVMPVNPVSEPERVKVACGAGMLIVVSDEVNVPAPERVKPVSPWSEKSPDTE